MIQFLKIFRYYCMDIILRCYNWYYRVFTHNYDLASQCYREGKINEMVQRLIDGMEYGDHRCVRDLAFYYGTFSPSSEKYYLEIGYQLREPNCLMKLARVEIEKKNEKRVIEIYKAGSYYPECKRRLAHYYYSLGKTDHMIETYKEAISIGDYISVFELGNYYHSVGSYQKEIELYTECLSYFYNSLIKMTLIYLIGNHYENFGPDKLMIKFYNENAQNFDIQSIRKLGDYYSKSMELRKMRRYYKFGYRMNDNYCIRRLAEYYRKRGKCDKMINCYKKSTLLGSGDSAWKLALFYRKIENTEESLKWYKRGILLGEVKCLRGLVRHYYQENETDLALFYAEKGGEFSDIYCTVFLAIYYDQIGCEKRREYYLKGAMMQDPYCLIKAARLYPERMTEFYETGAKNYTYFCLKLIEYYESLQDEKYSEKIISYYKDCLKNGDPFITLQYYYFLLKNGMEEMRREFFDATIEKDPCILRYINKMTHCVRRRTPYQGNIIWRQKCYLYYFEEILLEERNFLGVPDAFFSQHLTKY